MNIKEIEKKLAISFHDAILHKIKIDYLSREAELELDVSTGDSDSQDKDIREKRRMMRLKLKNVLFFVIERPYEKIEDIKGQELMIDMGEIDSLKDQPDLQEMKKLAKTVPKEAFSYWLFISNWNSFMFFSALEAKYKWV